MKKPQELSNGDSKVLTQIFDPESAPMAGVVIDASLPTDLHIQDDGILAALKARELVAIRLVEATNGPKNQKLDETEKYDAYIKASEILSLLIEQYPNYASAYNNRAQLARWRYGGHLVAQEHDETEQRAVQTVMEIALVDLNTAINLATPRLTSSPLSPSQAKLLAQAHTQRGAFLYTAFKDLEILETSGEIRGELTITSSIAEVQDYTAEMFEEASAKDFFLGGRYGNDISKAMAVHTNPYAKMCGNIVKEAMRKEISPHLELGILGIPDNLEG